MDINKNKSEVLVKGSWSENFIELPEPEAGQKSLQYNYWSQKKLNYKHEKVKKNRKMFELMK